MTDPLRILVLDDRPENEEANAENLKAALAQVPLEAEVESCSRELGQELVNKAEQMRSDPEGEDAPWKRHPRHWSGDLEKLEKYDILFVDYQLPELEGHGWLTAEDLAGLFRGFAGIPYIAVLNRFDEVDFDLSMSSSFVTAADLHINAPVLSNPGLWKLPDPADSEVDVSRFRPWHWPELPRAIDNVKKRRDDITCLNFDTKVLDFLDFNDRRKSSLDRSALGLLDPDSQNPEGTTFKTFLENGCVSVDSEVRGFLAGNLETGEFKKIAARIVAFELGRWLGDIVLPPQDTLIDVPHLAYRMPWLVDGDINSDEVWSQCVTLEENGALKERLLTGLWFEKEHWLPKRAFWLPDIQGTPEIDGEYEKMEADSEIPYAFQEDFSRFESLDNCEEYAAAFSSMWANRYISSGGLELDGVRYAPKVRLL